jgi:hypothetical protein
MTPKETTTQGTEGDQKRRYRRNHRSREIRFNVSELKSVSKIRTRQRQFHDDGHFAPQQSFRRQSASKNNGLPKGYD